MMKDDGKKREGKTRGYEGDETGRSVKRRARWFCKLTELINNPFKEQMLAEKKLT